MWFPLKDSQPYHRSAKLKRLCLRYRGIQAHSGGPYTTRYSSFSEKEILRKLFNELFTQQVKKTRILYSSSVAGEGCSASTLPTRVGPSICRRAKNISVSTLYTFNIPSRLLVWWMDSRRICVTCFPNLCMKYFQNRPCQVVACSSQQLRGQEANADDSYLESWCWALCIRGGERREQRGYELVRRIGTRVDLRIV